MSFVRIYYIFCIFLGSGESQETVTIDQNLNNASGKNSKTPGSLVIIVSVVTVGVVVLAIIIAASIFLYRRRSNKNKQ